jgi:hypothetical protein
VDRSGTSQGAYPARGLTAAGVDQPAATHLSSSKGLTHREVGAQSYGPSGSTPRTLPEGRLVAEGTGMVNTLSIPGTAVKG